MTLGSHQKTIGASQQHVTPRAILDSLGEFDLDPCAADPRPWDCARVNYTKADNGLVLPWFGRIWLNPPFDRRVVGAFIARMAAHGRGVALLHARTDTAWFQPIWDAATALRFLRGRVVFRKEDGSPQTTGSGRVANSGAPVVLIAFGSVDADVLAFCGLDGAFVPLRIPRSLLVEAVAPSWREAVAEVLAKKRGPVSLAEIYCAFAGHPKTRRNKHWRAKLRQVLQGDGFVRVGRGVYAAERGTA